MKKSRFSEEKIISILKQLEAGAKATELARKYGVSDVTIYNWKGRYGEMEVSQLRRLKELESENARLKRMFADLSLTHQALQDAVAKSCKRLRSQLAGAGDGEGPWHFSAPGVPRGTPGALGVLCAAATTG
jgi:putative transposase